MASEVGVVDVDSKNVFKKGRLFPGMMLLVDFEKHKVVDDNELKKKYASQHPYGEWLERQKLSLQEIVNSVPGADRQPPPIIGALEVETSDETMDHMGTKGLIAPLRAFGYLSTPFTFLHLMDTLYMFPRVPICLLVHVDLSAC